MNIFSIAGAVAALTAWASYLPVVKTPALRKTLWPLWIVFALSLVLAGIGFWRDEPSAMEFGVGTISAFLIYAFTFLFVLRLPAGVRRPAPGSALAHFEVLTESGAALSIAEYTGQGPLLLIFFRGFW